MRDRAVVRVDGDVEVMNAASLVKQVIAHLTRELIEDLDEPILGEITVRHVLTHNRASKLAASWSTTCASPT